MEIIEKEVHKDGEYTSKATGNAALTLGIIGTAGLLLNNKLSNLFGNSTASTMASEEYQYLDRKQCQDYLDITTKYYEGKISSLRELADTFNNVNSKIDANSFSLYKNQRDSYDVLEKRISNLECQSAVEAAVAPWREKVLNMQIAGVNNSAQAGIALEAERRANAVQLEADQRCCADNSIVNYVNGTFYPVNIANVTVGTTSTGRTTYNPLCGCCTPIYCNPSVTQSAG